MENHGRALVTGSKFHVPGNQSTISLSLFQIVWEYPELFVGRKSFRFLKSAWISLRLLPLASLR